MSNVRIGPDGSIIKDDEVVSSGGGTIIRDDGTIETTNLGGHSTLNVMPVVNTPPVSPLENRSRTNVGGQTSAISSSSSNTHSNPTVSKKVIAEKEYDLQMLEGRIRNAFPKQWVIATIVLCVIGAMGLYFLFVPAIATGIMIFIGLSHKSELEAERDRMYDELEELKDRGRV